MTRQEWNERRWLRLQRKMLAIQMGFHMAENANKPRNSTNGVSFAELMRMLKGQ